DVEQDQGEHLFTYSLLPHEGDWVEAHTEQAAWALNQPLQVIEGNLGEQSFIQIDNEEVVIDAVKRSEDGKYLVVRFHEYVGSKQKVIIKLKFGFKAWAESDLRERAIEAFKTTQDIVLAVKPYEIKTLLIEL
ncbi:MAG: glycosyl hydrolase-related protein, partial [Cellulosilyticaceae bacterium]